MPHGGGHVHHGGGGHFSGGGGHHHHGGYHHHHHHRHYGGVVYTGGGGYYYRSRNRGFVWGIVGAVLIIVVIVTVSCSVTLSKEENEENHYTPGATRIKSFGSFFCAGVRPKTSYVFDDASAKAYIIDKPPPLSVRNNVSLDDRFSLSTDDYSYWHFYLYPHSNITLQGCVDSSSNGYWLYIIKGTSKWNDWKDYASDSKAVYNAYITAKCDDTMAEKTYRVKSEDHYYIAYYNDGQNMVSGKQTLSIQRFEYAEPKSSDLPSCSFAGPNSGDSCELKVPMLSNHTKVLVRLPNVDETKKEDTIILDINCISRPSAYAIVIVSPIAFVVLLIVLVVMSVICCVKSKRRKYQPLVTNPVTAQSADTPPPFNPVYNNETPPPPYKS